MDAAEGMLLGSGDHHGAIRRVGTHVVRPAGPHSPAVHAFLTHLRAEGFVGSPQVVEASDSEEVLTFIEGYVPVPPEPPTDGWRVVSDQEAASVAALLRQFHAASRTFQTPEDAHWQLGRPDVEGGIVCHNDPVVGNIVFRDGEAVGLIDFDFAGPNDPLRDLAVAAQHWVPLGDPPDLLEPTPGWSPGDRLAAMCEAYGLSGRAVRRVLDLVDIYLERGRQGVLARVNEGQARFIAYWEAGLGDRLLRAHEWLRREGQGLFQAIG